MKTYDEAGASLLAAIEPAAAYLERTARPNRHADQLEELVNAALDFGEAADQRLSGPDWESIALRMARYLEPTAPPSPIVARTRAHLDQPHLLARAALPLARRMALAAITSHHLSIPDYLRDDNQQPL